MYGDGESGGGSVRVPLQDRMVILVASPLTRNIYDRIGAETLSRYFGVSVLDCLEWLRPAGKAIAFEAVEREGIVLVSNEAQFRDALRALSPAFLLDFGGVGAKTRLIQEACRRSGVTYIAQMLSPAPHPISQATLIRSLRRHPVQTFAKAVNRLWRMLKDDKPLRPDVALVAGSASRGGWLGSAMTTVRTASSDYFELLRVKQDAMRADIQELGLEAGEYILFIDDCLALSFDYELEGSDRRFDVQTYFDMLTGTFDRMERMSGKKVVVAAHPNGREYDGYADLFGDRVVVFGRTARLALDCALAVSHYSTAISFAVLCRKRILLLNARVLDGTPQGRMIDYLGESLGRAVIYMDGRSGVDWSGLAEDMPVDDVRYSAYESRYISEVETSDRDAFETLAQALQRWGTVNAKGRT